MSVWDYISNKVSQKLYRWARTFSTTPTFMQFGDNIMNDDTVASIVNRILDEYAKLNPRHIRMVNGKEIGVRDNTINALLRFPNETTTKSMFFRKFAYMRYTKSNAYAYPAYDLYVNNKTGERKKVYKAIYILDPVKVDFYEDSSNTLYIEFTFQKGQKSGKILYNDVIHWVKDFGPNEFLGGNINGFSDNSALLRYLETNDKLIQSTFKSIEGSLRINGVIKYAGLVKEEKREEDRLKFEKSLEENKTGIVAIDGGSDYVHMPFYGRQVSDTILKYFEDKIRKHYGVSEAIHRGDYTHEQKEAFYESVMEEGVISLGEAFTRVFFTPFQRANGNEIIFYANHVQMMSADKKIALANLLKPTGGVLDNEIRSWFSLEPIDGGDEPMMSLNWVKKSLAEQYQLELYKKGNASNSKDKTEKETDSEDDDKVVNEDDKDEQTE